MRRHLLGFAVLLGIAWPLASATADATVTITTNTDFNVYWKVDLGRESRLYGTITSRFATGRTITVLYAPLSLLSGRRLLCSYTVPAGTNNWTATVQRKGDVAFCVQTNF